MGSSSERLTEDEANEDEWATATRRVLLYLKALGVSPRHALTLAQQALDRAEAEPGLRREQAALVSLRSLLQTRAVPGNRSLPVWALEGAPVRGNLAAVPPLNRGSMTPARIDRRPWLTFLARGAGRCLPCGKKRRREASATREVSRRNVRPEPGAAEDVCDGV